MSSWKEFLFDEYVPILERIESDIGACIDLCVVDVCFFVCPPEGEERELLLFFVNDLLRSQDKAATRIIIVMLGSVRFADVMPPIVPWLIGQWYCFGTFDNNGEELSISFDLVIGTLY